VFIEMQSGERFHVLLRDWDGAWVISYDKCQQPFFVDREVFQGTKRIPAPEEYTENFLAQRTEAAQERYELIFPALQEERCITDESYRNTLFKKIAEENKTTVNRIRRLYCNYLATGNLIQKKPRERVIRAEYDDAIRKYYFSAKRNSLRTAYELMILERYTNTNGKLKEDIPTWDSFRHYYDRYWSKAAQKKISRGGLSNYQRNERMLYGSAMAYRDCVGSYQIDETMGDVFLVSKFDRSKVIGRPYIYLAVDTCTQLITGVYVGLEAGETAILACIANAVSDKVGYCEAMGIEIAQADWPCSGMPTELITDKGGEFTGQRISELCIRYGVEINTLPPFRPEEKPLVERVIGLVQDSYKSMLQGKGGIGADVNERWAIDYRQQAVLTLEEYTQIVIRCIINLNKGRILKGLGHLPAGVPQTPASLWLWFQEQGKTTLMDVDAHEVYLCSLPRTTAKVSRKGISFNHMRYLPPRGTELCVGEKVEFAYDTQDTEHIYIVNMGKDMIPCSLASSNAQYSGYDTEDVMVIRDAERETRKQLKHAELENRIAMRNKILRIVAQAEEQSAGRKDISDIASNRDMERRKMS